MADPTADPVLDAMRAKLAMYEAAGMTDQVAQVKTRIAKREKGVPKAAPPVRLSDVASRRSSDVATPVTPTNPTVKKAAKKPARKR